MLFDYDNKDKDSIYRYAKKLEGMTFREIIDVYNKSPIKQYENTQETNSSKIRESNIPYMAPNYIYNPNAKGQLGVILENCYFGYKPNSKKEADFSNVGIELKQTAIDKTKKGELRAGERLSITNISFDSPVEENFYQSHLWNKIKMILLVQYIRNKSVNRLDYRISFVNFFSPPEKDLMIIRQDYEKINDKIKAGKAHELSESDTLYLGAATKGATAQKSMVPQYYGNHTLAKKRNYCYKQKYMNYVLHEYILKKDDAEIAELFKPVLAANGVNVADYSDAYITSVVSLVKSRVNFVKELWEQARFFFVAPTSYAEKDIKKRWKEDTPAIMKELIEVLRGIEDFSSKPSEDIVIGWITEKQYHMGNVMNAFRLAVVGECKGPHMFDITELLGKEETIRRIEKAIEVLK